MDGGNGWVRTSDFPIFSRALCLLSYSAVHTPGGVEVQEAASPCGLASRGLWVP